MVVALHQLTAAAYLAACLAAGVGLALGSLRATQLAVALLGLGALVQTGAFATLHTSSPPPPITDFATATSLMAWIGVLGYLLMLRRARLSGLVVLVAPMAFLGVFVSALRLPQIAAATAPSSGSVPHAHVLLASAGLALLGLAGLAGALFIAEHRRLKHHRPLARSPLPSLEALDRAGALALGLGFPLLTLGVITGAMWVYAMHGSALSGSPHEITALLAWGVYVALALQRFAAHQSAHRCALSALVGFALLSAAVLGVEWLA